MLWDDDALKYQKQISLDVIITFSRVFRGKDPSEISVKDLIDFIDEFFETKGK